MLAFATVFRRLGNESKQVANETQIEVNKPEVGPAKHPDVTVDTNPLVISGEAALESVEGVVARSC